MNNQPVAQSVLSFRIDDQLCAIRIENVIEVAAMVELMKIRSDQVGVLGVVNRHGKSLTLIDMGLVVGQKPTKIDITTLFIVAQGANHEIGLVVDEVIQVDHIDHISPAPTNATYVEGVFSRQRDLGQLIAVELIIDMFLKQKIEE